MSVLYSTAPWRYAFLKNLLPESALPPFCFMLVLYSTAPWRYASVKSGFQSLSFRHFVLCQFCIRPHRGAMRL
jgi:hypothetical protein